MAHLCDLVGRERCGQVAAFDLSAERAAGGRDCYLRHRRRTMPLCDQGIGLERINGIALGTVLVADVAIVGSGGDGLHDRWVVDLLLVVEVLAAGIAGGVEVADAVDVVGDVADEIAFHDLHVVDVVEQLEPGRVDGPTQGHAPSGMVALVVGMVDARVEQFHAEGDAFFLGGSGDAAQAGDAVGEALF